MKKMMMMCVFMFAFVFNTMAYEQFGESDKNFASWMAARKLGSELCKDAAACAAICKDMEQAELIRKQKKLVEVQTELAIEQKKLVKAQTELAAEQKKLVKVQTELLTSQVKEVLKSIRYYVDEKYKRTIHGWMK